MTESWRDTDVPHSDTELNDEALRQIFERARESFPIPRDHEGRASVAKQLDALDQLTLNSPLRKKMRVTSLVCSNCGQLILEVVSTVPYRAIRFRQADDWANTDNPSSRRRTKRMTGVALITDQFEDAPTERIWGQVNGLRCRCRSHQVPLEMIAAQLRDRIKKASIGPRAVPRNDSKNKRAKDATPWAESELTRRLTASSWDTPIGEAFQD